MSFDIVSYNTERDRLQKVLDAQKTSKERNMKGQFATPYPLACSIMRKAKTLCHKENVSFIEPSIGLGTFYAAFRSVFKSTAGHALGFEIDEHYYNPARELWAKENLELRNVDFLKERPNDERFDLLVANPPYVRHHHINSEKKKELQKEVMLNTGIKISGLAGLYCYFLILSEKWLADDALSCWLIPSEFLDVNYGKAIKQYLLECVDLLCIHKFKADDVQFDDALVSSTIVFFRKGKPSEKDIEFSYGKDVNAPSKIMKVERNCLTASGKWSNLFVEKTTDNSSNDDCKLGNFFTVKRGIATGDNDFFVVDMDTIEKYHIPSKFLKPVLPSPRYLKGDIILSDNEGNIALPQKHYLFSCNLPEDVLMEKYPSVWDYIQEGIKRGVNKGYICSHRPLWYFCEDRKPAPFVIPYMGRGDSSKKMFRFILNKTRAITTNVYLLLYPKDNYSKCLTDINLLNEVWQALNEVTSEQFAINGREYGGGLHKLEPKELLNIKVPALSSLLLPRQCVYELSLF